MREITNKSLNGVAETLLITLYLRAMESRRPDALIQDEKAVMLIKRLGFDFAQVRLKLTEYEKVTLILRNREFDRYARDFLTRHPEAVVVHIGCGLDLRFARVDNGKVEWYDLDLPDVIKLRRKFIGDEGARYHLLGCSVFDNSWLDMVSARRQCPFLFLAEGVFMYFEKGQVKPLVLMLRDHFPGAELVFDTFSPLHMWTSNLRLSFTRLGARIHWGLWRGQEVEGWGEGIRLLGEWGFFDDQTPRLDYIRWMRYIPLATRALRIYHFRLGMGVP